MPQVPVSDSPLEAAMSGALARHEQEFAYLKGPLRLQKAGTETSRKLRPSCLPSRGDRRRFTSGSVGAEPFGEGFPQALWVLWISLWSRDACSLVEDSSECRGIGRARRARKLGRPALDSPLTPGWSASRALRTCVGRDCLRLKTERMFAYRLCSGRGLHRRPARGYDPQAGRRRPRATLKLSDRTILA